MKEASVKIEPRPVTPDDFEDLLATDDLFIEYFNSFLALPSFPEPLFFNKDTGGFEIVTDAKEKLATEIKAAVRAGRPKKKIYRAVRHHAFMPVPLIPMEEPSQEAAREIDTSFIVQTLNKEQGIEWIKKERLPTFLESECYLEYRLANMVSQCQVISESDEPVTLKLDTSPWPVTVRVVKEEEEEEPDEDEEEPEIDEEPQIVIPTKGKIMRDLFVSMGETSSTDTEAWVSQAKMALTTVTQSGSTRLGPVSSTLPTGTSTRLSRPMSGASRPMSGVSRPMSGVSGRPISSLSQSDSAWRDSGIGSPSKMSLQGSMLDVAGGYANSLVSQDDKESLTGETLEPPTPRAHTDEGVLNSKLFGPESKPITPRPCDTVCLVLDGGSRRGAGRVYVLPPNSPLDEDSEASSPPPSTVPTETASQRSTASPEPLDDLDQESTDSKKPSLVFDNIDELGSVIVGTVLKQAVASTTGIDPDDVVKSNQLIRDLYPSDSMSRISVDDLDHVELSSRSDVSKTESLPDQTDGLPLPEQTEGLPLPDQTEGLSLPDQTDGLPAHVPLALSKNQSKSFELTKTIDLDSGEDSLLDSDDDYDEERDKIFKKKVKRYKLVNGKGIERFKKFLRKTKGEKNWFFWLDIDRGRVLISEKESSGYLAAMRERYQHPGALFELSKETKQDLGLVEPSNWTMEKLKEIQNRVAEPLLLYWGPRFILEQVSGAKPRKNYLYNQQRCFDPLPDSHPNPPTLPLLPLRPKTCMPRLRQMEPPQMQITSMFDDPEPPVPEAPKTTPTVGMKRTHSLPDMYKTTRKKDKEKINLEKQKRTKTPKQLVTGRAKTARKPDVPRPPAYRRATQSAHPRSSRSSDQWDTFSNLSMPSTVRSESRVVGVTKTSSTLSLTGDHLSDMSEFKGGRRMEGLLQALAAEKRAGGVIKKYLETTCNQLWLNCLEFWHDLQEYHHLFYSEVLDDYLLTKKAKYVVAGAPHNIHSAHDIRSYIHDHLVPPYEELFDSAEEYVLEMLFDAWSQMIVCDMSTFDKVELIEVKRHIDAKSKYMVSLQRRGIIKEAEVNPQDNLRTRTNTLTSDFMHSRSLSESFDMTETNHNPETKTPEDIFRDYFIIPGTQEVLTQDTILERQRVIEEVSQQTGPMRHLSEEEKLLILNCISPGDKISGSVFKQEQTTAQGELIEKLNNAKGNFNTLSKKDRDKIIKMIHVNEMIQNDCPNAVDLEVVSALYDGNPSEDYGLILIDKKNELVADLQAARGSLVCVNVNVRKALVKCIDHINPIVTNSKNQGNLSKHVIDDIIRRMGQDIGEFKGLDAEMKVNLLTFLVIVSGGISMRDMSTATQINLVKYLRTAKSDYGKIQEDTRLKIIELLKGDASSEVGFDLDIISLINDVRNGKGEFSQLTNGSRKDLADFLSIATRKSFIINIARKKQENLFQDLERKALAAEGSSKENLCMDDLNRIKDHLATDTDNNEGKKLKSITILDRDFLLQRLESGKIGQNLNNSEREIVLNQLTVARKNAVQKVLKSQKAQQKGKAGQGFPPFGEGNGTLGEIIERAREAGESWDDILRPSTPDDSMGNYQDPVYDEALMEKIPDEFKDYGLEKLVHNRIELEHFRRFLEERHTSMDLSCWLDIESFRRTPHHEEKKRDHKAKDIKSKYLNKKYFFGPNSPAGKEGQDIDAEYLLTSGEESPSTRGSEMEGSASQVLKLPSILPQTSQNIEKKVKDRISTRLEPHKKDPELVSVDSVCSDAEGDIEDGVPSLVNSQTSSRDETQSLYTIKHIKASAKATKTVRFLLNADNIGDTDDGEDTVVFSQGPIIEGATSVLPPSGNALDNYIEGDTEDLIAKFIEEVMEVGGGWGKLLGERPPTASILEAQKYARTRLEKKWLPLFLGTAEFTERQRPKSSMDDVVEDVMIQKKKKSQAIWRMLESRWVSSSKDVITFRKALLNPITSHQFRRFVSIKGDNYENDVLFWQEVQRYKDLCHLHSDRSLIQQKTITIVNCFIDSPIPPSVQVDITQEMADTIVARKLEATPYLFREAQLTVFRVLFPYWSDFSKFRQNLSADKILPTIERHRRRAKAEERRRHEEAQERKEKLKRQRIKMKENEKQLMQERLAKGAQTQDRLEPDTDKATSTKEIAKRRALGLPVTTDETNNNFREPHEVPSSDGEDEAEMAAKPVPGPDENNQDQVTWSYSGYMKALDEEKVLNEVDEATFSCVSDMSKTAPRKDYVDMSEDPSSRRGSIKKSARLKVEEKPRSRPPSAGSQSSSRPKTSRPRSSRVREAIVDQPDHHDHMRPPVPPDGGASRRRRTPQTSGDLT